jgi:hypothetical protein
MIFAKCRRADFSEKCLHGRHRLPDLLSSDFRWSADSVLRIVE